MKKGFTLIELLSVIIILAIILVIVVPQVLKALNSSTTKAHISNNQMVIKSAKLFVANNTSYLPSEIGNTSEITVDELISNNVLKEFKLGSNDCSGYVLITKINENDYDYTPHINCFENIENSQSDNLLLHYKFSDFQESTQNIYPRASTSVAFSSAFNGSSYGFGTNTNMQQVIDNSLQITEEASVTKVSRIESDISQRDYVSINVSSPLNSTRILTFWYYGTYGNTIRPYNNDGSATLYYLNENNEWVGNTTSVTIPVVTNNWQKITIKVENRGVIAGTGLSWMVLHNEVGSATLDTTEFWAFTKFQYEEKEYATDYTPTNREAVIKDYSPNNNIAILPSSSKLKHFNLNNGTYLFNGINTNIQTSNLNIDHSNPLSISIWFKNLEIDSNIVRVRLVNKKSVWNSNDGFAIQLHTGGQVKVLGSGTSEVTSSVLTEWDFNRNHLLVVFNSTNQPKIYFNGKLKEIDSGSITQPIINTTDLYIGGSLGNFFNGYIDDVKLYNRELNDKEIKNLYEATK